jgi:hypothetical protein
MIFIKISTIFMILQEFQPKFRITFRLYMTLQAAYKANRRFAAACNVAE